MSEHVTAALAGGLTAMIGKVIDHWSGGDGELLKTSIIIGIEVLITGFCMSYFLAPNIILVFEKYLEFTVLSGAIYFLCAHYGADLSRQMRVASKQLLPIFIAKIKRFL